MNLVHWLILRNVCASNLSYYAPGDPLTISRVSSIFSQLSRWRGNYVPFGLTANYRRVEKLTIKYWEQDRSKAGKLWIALKSGDISNGLTVGVRVIWKVICAQQYTYVYLLNDKHDKRSLSVQAMEPLHRISCDEKGTRTYVPCVCRDIRYIFAVRIRNKLTVIQLPSTWNRLYAVRGLYDVSWYPQSTVSVVPLS